jgi:putative hydrolase of the HAD superfamily
VLARDCGFAHVLRMLARPAEKAENGPDFRHIDTWIFDLDNTLYRADSDLFALIDARMSAYVANLLGVTTEEARKIQKEYYRDYGTTLSGLIRVHGIDPETFLSDVHDIDLTQLEPDPVLNRAISRLPGRRFVFTNGCRNYAQRVLERIGLADVMADIWDIRTIAFQPKPKLTAYERVLADASIIPSRAAMFEDVARNLVPARALGMTTVWINNGSVWSRQGPEHPVAQPHHIDYETTDLSAFLSTIRT